MQKINLLALLALFSTLATAKNEQDFPTFGLPPVDLEESLSYYQKNLEFERKKMTTKRFLQILKNKEYDQLETYFSSIEQANNQHILSINHYYNLFNAPLDDMGLSNMGLVNAWTDNQPDSYYAHMVAGSLYYNLGGQARGTKFASNTSDQQFSSMKNFYQLAQEHLIKAIELNPKGELAYVHKMGMDRGFTEMNKTFKSIQEHIPHSYLAHNLYISKLKPRWYGSYPQMRAFAVEAQKHTPTHSRMRVLLGQEAADMAHRFKTKKDYEKAIEFYNHALYHGAFAGWIEKRRDSYFLTEQLAEALPDTLLLDKTPINSAKLLYKSIIVKHHNQVPFDDNYKTIKRLDRDGSIVFDLGAYFKFKNKSLELAEDLFRDAISKDPVNEFYHHYLVNTLKASNSPKYDEADKAFNDLCKQIKCKLRVSPRIN